MQLAARPTCAWFLILAGPVLTAPARAELICDPDETIEACWGRYLPEEPTDLDPKLKGKLTTKKEHATAAEEERLKTFETGLDGGAPALATTTRNFLPLMTMAGLLSDSDGNAADNLMALDLNFLIPTLAEDRNAQLKAVLNTDPTLFEPLREAIDALPDGSDTIAAMESELDAADDYTLSFTYNHMSSRYGLGRSFEQYRQRYSTLFEAAITKATAEVSTASALALQNFLVERVGNADLSKPLKATPGLQEVVERAASEAAQLEARLLEISKQHQLPMFAELVNNQPQLTVSAEFRERDVIVGAREKSLKIAYEFGFASAGGFEAASGAACDNPGDVSAASACLTAFKRYVDDREQHLRNADRFVAELSYVEIDDYAFERDGISLAREGTSRLDISLGAGRTLRALGDDRETRVDLVAKYEDHDDDPERRDRLVATLTLTTKVAGISMPISLVYANHSQFLPEVDEQLTAHIGVKFAMDPKKDK